MQSQMNCLATHGSMRLGNGRQFAGKPCQRLSIRLEVECTWIILGCRWTESAFVSCKPSWKCLMSRSGSWTSFGSLLSAWAAGMKWKKSQGIANHYALSLLQRSSCIFMHGPMHSSPAFLVSRSKALKILNCGSLTKPQTHRCAKV